MLHDYTLAISRYGIKHLGARLAREGILFRLSAGLPTKKKH